MLKFQELALTIVVAATYRLAQTARNFTASSRQISRQIFDRPLPCSQYMDLLSVRVVRPEGELYREPIVLAMLLDTNYFFAFATK